VFRLLYLIFLIVVVFGGGYFFGKSMGWWDGLVSQPPIGTLIFEDKELTILRAVPGTTDTGQRLDVTISATTEEQAFALAPKLFDICQTITGSELFAERLTGITELGLDFARPGDDTALFNSTLPISGGVCQ